MGPAKRTLSTLAEGTAEGDVGVDVGNTRQEIAAAQDELYSRV